MIHKLHCPICNRKYIFCIEHYPKGNDKYHIDGTFCLHLLDTIKSIIMLMEIENE